ncbi:MAG TPA: PadR family transcriptional regulator [Candidatus Cybelea sp.]|jgi:DNA-binding PadR family transcriptional regulator
MHRWEKPRHGLRRFRRGILKFALLKLLAEMPSHGYELIRVIREKGWGGGAGSVYPLLAALEAAGFISGREEGDRRIYELTEKGRKMLEERASDIGRFFEADEEEEGTGDARAQMREAADRLMHAVSQMSYSSKPETVERVRELLDEGRKKIYEVLAQE